MSEIQHHLVHARDLADSAARLMGQAQEVTDSDMQRRMEATARRLLEKADALLEGDAPGLPVGGRIDERSISQPPTAEPSIWPQPWSERPPCQRCGTQHPLWQPCPTYSLCTA